MSNSPFLKRLALGLLSVCLLLPCLLTAQTTRATEQITPTKHPFLWRIEGKGDQTFNVKSWLYGTMHLGDERLVALPEAVEDALEAADALYCELDMDRMQKQLRKLMSKMVLPRGQTLKDRLSAELYDRLSDYVAERGSSMVMFKRMQVWAVSVNLAVIEAAKQKMTKSLDMMLYKDAKAEDKEVGGLETMDEQLGAMADMPEEDHIKMLEMSLDYMEKLTAKGISPLRRMQKIYLAGDGDKLWELAKEAMGADKELMNRFLKLMLTDRNVRMADRLAKMIQDNPEKCYFFAVGAMHYPGRDGMLDVLRRKGYRITRINPPRKVKADSRQGSRELEKAKR